jgi:hypothetical protein
MTQSGRSPEAPIGVQIMMGMGFLRLNRVLAKHKWDAREESVDEGQARSERRLFFVAAVIVVIAVGVVIYLIY